LYHFNDYFTKYSSITPTHKTNRIGETVLVNKIATQY